MMLWLRYGRAKPLLGSRIRLLRQAYNRGRFLQRRPATLQSPQLWVQPLLPSKIFWPRLEKRVCRLRPSLPEAHSFNRSCSKSAYTLYSLTFCMPEKPPPPGSPAYDLTEEDADDLLRNPDFLRRVKQEADRTRNLKKMETVYANLALIRGQLGTLKAVDVRGEVVTGASYAPIFAEAHQTHNRAVAIVDALRSPNEIVQRTMSEIIESLGAFVGQEYTVDYERNRLEHPAVEDKSGWVMSIAHGSPISSVDFAQLSRRIGGMAEIFVPPDDSSAELPVELRLDQPQDEIISRNRKVYEEMVANPASIAWLSDVSSYRGTVLEDGVTIFLGHGFAARATDAGHRYIESLNQFRKNPIRYCCAAIIEIEGVVDAQGTPLASVNPPWLSKASFDLHAKRRRHVNGVPLRSYELGRQMSRLAPVKMPAAENVSMKVNWNVVTHELYQPAMKASVSVPEGVPPVTPVVSAPSAPLPPGKLLEYLPGNDGDERKDGKPAQS